MDLAAFLWTVIAVIAGMTIWYAGFVVIEKAVDYKKDRDYDKFNKELYEESNNGL